MRDCKIILLTNEFPPAVGGVATYCWELTRATSELGASIAVVAARKAPHSRRQQGASFDFPVHYVPEHPLRPVRHVLRLRAFIKAVREYRPTVLWAVDWRTGLIITAVARYFRLPYVVTAFGSEILIAQRNFLTTFLAKWVYRHARAVLSISTYTNKLLASLGIPGGNAYVIPLGIDANHQEIQPGKREMLIRKHNLEGKKVILTLARLTPRKGQDTVIAAMPHILEQIPEAVYLIVGAGEDYQRLQYLVEEAGLTEHVIFAGYVPDDEKVVYYDICDVYVMPSRKEGDLVEGFGLTFLEAAARCKPVVAGKHGGAVEAVASGKTGIVVPPTKVDAVANAIIHLLTHPDIAKEMGIKGRRYVEESANWRVVATSTLEVICSSSPSQNPHAPLQSDPES